MKKYTNRLIVIILTVVALFSFTSCDNHYWTEGFLHYESSATASPAGVIAADLRVDYSWIEIEDVRTSRVEDLKFRGGCIDVSLVSGSIQYFRLSLSDSDAYIDVDMRGITNGRLEGSRVDTFLRSVIEVMKTYGDAVIYVDSSTASSRASVYLDFLIDIKAYVRE